MTWASWLLLVVVLATVLMGFWLSWTANRLDRMHHRIEVARAALDAARLRRSGAALELGTAEVLDKASALILLEAAHAARLAPPDQTEGAESELSQVLRAVLADQDEVRALREHPDVGPLMRELAVDCRKVELARRFHNDMVVNARSLRSRRRVRWLRLAGRAAPLSTVDLDDVPPEGLGSD